MVTREYRATRHSWLDFFGGRPTVGFEIDDFYVPEKQILQYKFQVTYRFAGSQMFHETVFLAVLNALCLPDAPLKVPVGGTGFVIKTSQFDVQLTVKDPAPPAGG